MRIGWIGYHIEGIPAFKNLLELGYRIHVFMTLSEDKLIKRSGFATDYIDYCRDYEIPVLKVNNVNDKETADILRGFNLDIIFVIGWGQILSEEILKIPKFGIIGAHASLLPKNRGSAPINWTIINGETKTGNTLILLDPSVDEGEIIDQMGFDVTHFDTCKSLYDKVAETNKVMIEKFVSQFQVLQKIVSHKQNYSDQPVLKRRKPSDGLIDWAQDSYAIYNFIRGLTIPYPGAFSFINNEKWMIWNASWIPLSESHEHQAGEIVGPVYNSNQDACGKLVSCSKGYIIIHSIQNSKSDIISGYKLAEYSFGCNLFSNE